MDKSEYTLQDLEDIESKWHKEDLFKHRIALQEVGQLLILNGGSDDQWIIAQKELNDELKPMISGLCTVTTRQLYTFRNMLNAIPEIDKGKFG